MTAHVVVSFAGQNGRQNATSIDETIARHKTVRQASQQQQHSNEASSAESELEKAFGRLRRTRERAPATCDVTKSPDKHNGSAACRWVAEAKAQNSKIAVNLHLRHKRTNEQTDREKGTDTRNRIWYILALKCDIWWQ